MTTLTIELEDSAYERLREQAEAEHVTVPSMVAQLLVARVDRESEVAEAVEMARAHLKRYPVLFKRLAE
ncbi:MAG TPA: hypothetical protein VJQ83_09320 [Tepidiformaceae bacterium]|nr:hypothetical protein [Tepidiformaceae bacterium]